MNISSHKLKLIGTVELPEPLEEGKDYHISVEGTINGIGIDDNEDGFWEKTYKMRIATLELLDPPKQKIIKAKDKTKMSQKLRGAIYFYFSEHHPEEDEEVFYQKAMGLLIKNLDRILPFLLKEKQNGLST